MKGKCNMNKKQFVVITSLGFDDIRRVCAGDEALISKEKFSIIDLDDDIHLTRRMLEEYIEYVEAHDGYKIVVDPLPPLGVSTQSAQYGLIKTLLNDSKQGVSVGKSPSNPKNLNKMIVVEGVPKGMDKGSDDFKKFITGLMKTLDDAEEKFDNDYTTESKKKLPKYATKIEKQRYLNNQLQPEMNAYIEYIMRDPREVAESKIINDIDGFRSDVNLILLDWLYELKKYKIWDFNGKIPYTMVDCRSDSIRKIFTKNFKVTNDFVIKVADPLDESNDLIVQKHTMVYERFTSKVSMTYVRDKKQRRFEKNLIYLSMDKFPIVSCKLSDLEMNGQLIDDKFIYPPTHDYPYPKLTGLVLTFNTVKLYNEKGECYRSKSYPMIYDIHPIRWEGRTVSELTCAAVEEYGD